MGLFKFLKSLRTLAQNKNLTIEEAYKFAQQEFGEVNDLLKLQINKIFKDVEAPSIRKPSKPEGKVIEAVFKPGKDKYGKVVEESPSQRGKTFDELLAEEKTPLTKRLETGIEQLKGFKKPGKDLTTGMTRTAARVILDNAGIKVPEKVDPIDVVAKEFGVDVLMDLRDVAEELIEKERTGKITESMGEFLESRGMFDLKRGRTDMPKGYTDEEMKEIEKAIEQEDMLLRFDPKDREPNAAGGRVGYGAGGGVKALVKLINKKFGKGTVKLGKDVKRPESAEMREAFKAFKKRNKLAGGGAVKTILKIIEEIKKLDPMDAMKEVNEVVAKRGKYKNLSDEDTQKIFDETNDHIFERDVKPKETDIDFDEATEELAAAGAPKMAERFELKQKYPGIDDRLLTQIIDDPDPQRKAEVLATIDQAFALMKQGKSPDEVLDIMKQMTDRTKQAGGGLAYLMGL